jgi:hypothetical protein
MHRFMYARTYVRTYVCMYAKTYTEELYKVHTYAQQCERLSVICCLTGIHEEHVSHSGAYTQRILSSLLLLVK